MNIPSSSPPPTDPPVPPLTIPVPPLVNVPPTQLRSPTDGVHTDTTPRAAPPDSTAETAQARRIGKTALQAIEGTLSDRDRQILESIQRHRFLTTGHIQTLHFADHASPSAGARATRSVLERLRKHRLVATLDRRIGGIYGGSSTPTYFLDTAGIRLVSDASKRRRHEPSRTFVQHTLAIADTTVALTMAERAGQIELIAADPEPFCWRRYPGLGGAAVTLKPDLHAVTAPGPDSDFEDSWFIEIDLGTETIPTLIRKCREYESYRRGGTEQDRAGVFPIVVWVMSAPNADTAQRRIHSLTAQIARSDDLSDAIFRIITPDQLISLIQKGGTS